MKPEWCPQWATDEATRVYHSLENSHVFNEIAIARALLDAHQRGRREGMEEAGTDITERLQLRSLAINEALVEQRDVDAAILMSCDLPNIPAAAIRAKAQEVKT